MNNLYFNITLNNSLRTVAKIESSFGLSFDVEDLVLADTKQHSFNEIEYIYKYNDFVFFVNTLNGFVRSISTYTLSECKSFDIDTENFDLYEKNAINMLKFYKYDLSEIIKRDTNN